MNAPVSLHATETKASLTTVRAAEPLPRQVYRMTLKSRPTEARQRNSAGGHLMGTVDGPPLAQTQLAQHPFVFS